MLNLGVKDAIPSVPYSKHMDTLGTRIRQLREARGMTQEQLAKLVGVTKGAVSQWELGGTKNIKLGTFYKLLDIFQTNAEYMLHGPGGGNASRSRMAR